MIIKAKLYAYYLTHILYSWWGEGGVLFKVSFPPLIATFIVENVENNYTKKE